MPVIVLIQGNWRVGVPANAFASTAEARTHSCIGIRNYRSAVIAFLRAPSQDHMLFGSTCVTSWIASTHLPR